MSEDTVICGAHGETPVTFVCQHVADGVACGFHAERATARNRWPDAWCDLCEDVWRKAGGWTTRASKVASIKCLCTHCYEQARALNRKVPARGRGKVTKMTKREADDLVHHAVHKAMALQKRARKTWRHVDAESWQYSRDTNTITFTDPKRATVVADATLVGSFSTNTNTFQWAWETLNERDVSVGEIRRLQRFGTVRGIKRLSSPSFKAKEIDGWEMASLAAYLLGAEAIYRPPMDHLYWFMLLSNFRRVVKRSRGKAAARSRS